MLLIHLGLMGKQMHSSRNNNMSHTSASLVNDMETLLRANTEAARYCASFRKGLALHADSAYLPKPSRAELVHLSRLIQANRSADAYGVRISLPVVPRPASAS